MSGSSQYPRLADPSDLPRLVSGDRVFHTWPPPGTTTHRLAFPEAWVLVTGQPSGADPGDWYVTDLATIALELDTDVEQLLVALARLVGGPIIPLAGAAGSWPVIYEVGKVNAMRYLKATFRGTLGTTEQFQHQMCFGKPGADPTTSEAAALSLAEDLALLWANNFLTHPTAPAAGLLFPPAVAWTEVGVVEETITSAVAADGTGGNLEQSYGTQWVLYPGGPQVGGGDGNPLPFEVACAVTLQTGHRGASGRGRFYLPPLGTSALGAGGVFAGGIPARIGARVGDFFQALGVAHDLVPVVVSKRRLILNEVTSVNVGSVPDSQRRRRRSQDENRVTGWTKP